MKKLMFLIFAAMFSVAIFAQDKKMTEIKTSQLPKAVSEWVSQNIAGGSITKAGKIEENGVLSYVAMVDMKGQNRAFVFDKDGKFIGKADNVLKANPVAKPPVKDTEAKPATKSAVPQNPAPKK
jgi:hypothetical protein